MPLPRPASVIVGTAANRPAPFSAGRLYIATDTGQISEDTGAAWNDLPGGASTLAQVLANGNTSPTVGLSAETITASGISGATSSARFVGQTTGGAPTTGTYGVGDIAVDPNGVLYTCIAAGTPGTWTALTGGIPQFAALAADYTNTTTGDLSTGVGVSFKATGTTAVVSGVLQVSNNTIADGITSKVYLSTTAIPAQGAAPGGSDTAVWSSTITQEGLAGNPNPQPFYFQVSGLTVGTTYYLYLTIAAVTGGTATAYGGSNQTTIQAPIAGGGAASGGSGSNVLYHVTLSAAAASVTISNIPATHNLLRLAVLGAITAAAVDYPINMQFNGDTGANYNYIRMTYYTGASSVIPADFYGQNQVVLTNLPGTTAPASASGAIEVVIPGYARTTFYKAFTASGGDLWGATNSTVQSLFGNWHSTAAINSITLTPNTGSFAAGTDITLIGE